MESVVAQANRDIFEAANAHPSFAGMGTTLVAGIFLEHSLVLGHIEGFSARLPLAPLDEIADPAHPRPFPAGSSSMPAYSHPARSGFWLNRNLVTRALGVEVRRARSA